MPPPRLYVATKCRPVVVSEGNIVSKRSIVTNAPESEPKTAVGYSVGRNPMICGGRAWKLHQCLSSSRRGVMFIERATYKRLVLAPEERNTGRCCAPLPETSRSAGTQVLGFTVGSINLRSLRSPVVIWLRPKPPCSLRERARVEN